MGDRQSYLAAATATVDAPRGDVWALWVDVTGWCNWNGGVASSRLDGKFRPGSVITLELDSGQTVATTLVSVGQGEEFSDETVLPFGIIRNRHQMTPVGSLVTITHQLEAEIEADASSHFTSEVWPAMQATLSESLLELVDLAQV